MIQYSNTSHNLRVHFIIDHPEISLVLLKTARYTSEPMSICARKEFSQQGHLRLTDFSFFFNSVLYEDGSMLNFINWSLRHLKPKNVIFYLISCKYITKITQLSFCKLYKEFWKLFLMMVLENLMVKKISSWVFTLQGPIGAFQRPEVKGIFEWVSGTIMWHPTGL